MFKKYVETVEQTTLKMSGDNINQIQRNELKSLTVQALHDLLKENGVNVAMTNKGVVMTITTATGRKFNVEIDGIIKNAKYNLQDEIAEYNQTVADRLERERVRLEKKEKVAKERAELNATKKDKGE